jgi:acyl-homoserine-lactone acylase
MPADMSWPPVRYGIILLVAVTSLLTACSSNNSEGENATNNTLLQPSSGMLQATIRRTTGGVAHVRADNLASAAYGAGYAQAQDNVCLLAEGIVQARSERAKYFGPGPDNIHIINDFSYQVQRIHSGAVAELTRLSAETLALINGFTAGYNRYVRDTAADELPAECRNQPWVFEIEPVDLYAHYRIIGQFASGALLATGAVFLAVPPGESPEPMPVADSAGLLIQQPARVMTGDARRLAGRTEQFIDTGLASNAWGIGKLASEQGRGALLANPHFPYTGARRLYQVHMTVPDYLDVNGAGLLGTAVPLVSFNKNLGWSHTVSTSRRFTGYELTLKEGDAMTYIKDGEERAITSEIFRIEVANGTPQPTILERHMYFSEYGPMVAMDAVTGGALGAWGEDGKAFSYRDANASSTGFMDTWLQMSRASTLDEFQQVFRDCGSTLWTNTVYADDQGNTYYIDSSSVPNLSNEAIATVNAKREASDAYAQLFDAGLTLLDGSTSRDDWVEGTCNGLVAFADKPQLQRDDWVQNSNSSYWAANPEEFLSGFSPLYGDAAAPLNPRTRLGLSMLQKPMESGFASASPAGDDGKFSAQDLIGVIYNNRAFYSEMLLPELRARCELIGNTPVTATGGNSRSVDEGCAVLANWNGVYDTNTVGAHVFRVFMGNYGDLLPADLGAAFDPADPVNTPADPSAEDRGTADDAMLQALAAGLDALDSVGIAYNARLGDIQTWQASGGVPPGGDPQALGASLPWPGGHGNVDGAFNAIGSVASLVAEDTRIPRLSPQLLPNTAGLSATAGQGWPIARGTSWHFGLEFTADGPIAFGLMSYGQSTDSQSPFFSDQSERFSNKDFRPLLFNEADIVDNLLPDGELILSEAIPTS